MADKQIYQLSLKASVAATDQFAVDDNSNVTWKVTAAQLLTYINANASFVSQINTSNGITGGPITSTGTISLTAIATDHVLANVAGTSQSPGSTSVTSLLDAAMGNVEGDLLYRASSVWTVLAAGSQAGGFLKTGGSGAIPAYATTFWQDASNNVINSKGVADQSYSAQVPSTGFSITIGAGVRTLTLLPAGTLATGTITLPAAIDGQCVRVNSSKTITALTLAGNGGDTINNAPTTLVAGNGFDLQYNLANTAWNPLYQASSGGGSSPWTAGSGSGSAYGGGASSTTGTGALAWGSGASAGGTDAIALGDSTVASQTSCIALGFSANSFGFYSASLGYGATATNTQSTAIGSSTNANGASSTAVGYGATAAGHYSTCIGNGTATNQGSVVLASFSASGSSFDPVSNSFGASFSGGYYNHVGSTLATSIDTAFNSINLKGTSDQSYSLQTPTTGFSITIGAGVKTLLLEPAGTLASGTITMPASPIDGQEIRVSSTQSISALTLSGNSGQTISNPPTTLLAGQGFGYIYNLANTNWVPLATNGLVGQGFVTSNVPSGSAVSLSNGTAADVTFIDLPVGDWDVFGNVSGVTTGMQLAQAFEAWTSTTSATAPDDSLVSKAYGPSATLQNMFLVTPLLRVLVTSGTTRVYLSCLMNSATGTLTACGTISARPAVSNGAAGLVNYQISPSCSTFSTTNNTATAVTNLSVTITTKGNPVKLWLQSDGTNNEATMQASGSSYVDGYFFRGVTQLSYDAMGTSVPACSAQFLDVVGAGTYTYTYKISNQGGGTSHLNYSVLVAQEQ